jgi:ribosomal protein S18 acetylase RimI-like enzyme
MKARRAGIDDVPALVRLINAAYRVEDFFIHGDRTTDHEVRAFLGRPGAAFLVIDGPGGSGLSGSVYVEIHGDRGHISLLAVDPARQKQGLGRALVEAVEAHCRAGGCQALDLDVVNLRQELPSFYAALGFVPAGMAPFPDPAKLTRPAHLVMMTKSLAAA